MLKGALEKIGRLSEEFRSVAQSVREHGPPAREISGKSLLTQAIEITALRACIGRLAPDEYYQYSLYDDRRYDWAAKRRFFGRHWENALLAKLHSNSWVAIAHDKLVYYALIRQLGFPVPEIYAVFHPFRRYGAVPALQTTEQLAQFLRKHLRYPCIAKPVAGMYSHGIFGLQSFDLESDSLLLSDGDKLSVQEFVEQLGKNYLFQQLLAPHPSVRELCGDRICTVRMVVLLRQSGPQLLRALWKVGTGRNIADNYWRPGNMIGSVDIASGCVQGLVSGKGRHLRHVSQHPDTGKTLAGAILPDWPAAVDLVLDAARSVPGLRMQAWDMALTNDGPMPLELNIIGGFDLPQLSAQAGIYEGEFRAFLEECGLAPRRAGSA
jgi:hypothetical protein